jgi:hypothetical protein
MSNSDGQGRDLVSKPSTTVTVGSLGSVPVDLSSLTDEERAALVKDYARGVIEIDKKARELHVDGNSLKYTLDTLSTTAKQVSESGNAVTMTHSQTTKIGRTEIKIGNTEEAKSGKMSSSQTGDRNWTPYYIIGGLVAIVLIAFLFAGHH